jgi:phage baseplate assembly protein V
MAGEFRGVLIGLVTARDDSQGEGRVRLSFPTFEGTVETDWAPIASPMAGKARGFRFAPEIGDECLVAFDRGDPDSPYVVGFLHNGVDEPPSQDPQERVIASVNGHRIVFYDPDVRDGDRGRLTIEDGHGTSIELTNGHMRITAVGQLDIQADILTLNGRTVLPGRGAV